MDSVLFAVFGDVPAWAPILGTVVGFVVGALFALFGGILAVQQYRYESYHRKSIRTVEAVSAFVANVGFWLVAPTAVGAFLGIVAYATWPHFLWVVAVLGGLGFLFHYHSRPQ